jgi:ribosome-associated translation inhibitor RaiA
MTQDNFQQLVLDRLAKIDQEVRETNIKFDAYVKASEKIERLATTIIITAGTVTLLSPVLQSIAPTVKAFLGGAS